LLAIFSPIVISLRQNQLEVGSIKWWVWYAVLVGRTEWWLIEEWINANNQTPKIILFYLLRLKFILPPFVLIAMYCTKNLGMQILGM
jgi:hypothetical protein